MERRSDARLRRLRASRPARWILGAWLGWMPSNIFNRRRRSLSLSLSLSGADRVFCRFQKSKIRRMDECSQSALAFGPAAKIVRRDYDAGQIGPGASASGSARPTAVTSRWIPKNVRAQTEVESCQLAPAQWLANDRQFQASRQNASLPWMAPSSLHWLGGDALD
ncbi:hypothetical protein B0T17DRAFT_603646 [Bombardia bombarda]|uniref:Uncharacterized protein n=1 Tax=Bombardia bombarda TaxID=252184 RepID=A0AA39T0P2_9PEZI|nr:hypothetical protein B0T17DRAFT_603646 [Bombardia bombarda]